MKAIILALSLAAPAAFAAAEATASIQDVHAYSYGDQLDVAKVVEETVMDTSSATGGLETVKLVYQDHAGAVHSFYYKRLAETGQDN
ncbi:DUF2790 domain-containing protein [Pseudomonas putida]|uniref:DUF2790 domain-containing protein n=1 Tax=Pseudomonas putida TaxID=303 RepID=UPI00383A65AE